MLTASTLGSGALSADDRRRLDAAVSRIRTRGGDMFASLVAFVQEGETGGLSARANFLGLVPNPRGFAIRVTQVSNVVGASKSSLNRWITKQLYRRATPRADDCSLLNEMFPALRANSRLHQQWTFYERSREMPGDFAPARLCLDLRALLKAPHPGHGELSDCG